MSKKKHVSPTGQQVGTGGATIPESLRTRNVTESTKPSEAPKTALLRLCKTGNELAIRFEGLISDGVAESYAELERLAALPRRG